MKTATKVRELEGWRSHAILFRLSEPMEYGHYEDDQGSTEYVIVSAVVADFSGPETYIFPAREDGTSISMSELNGSYRGGLDHREALAGAGYTVVG